MLAIVIMGLAAILTILIIFMVIRVTIITWKDTVEFRKTTDSNFLKNEKEFQTRVEFKTYKTNMEEK